MNIQTPFIVISADKASNTDEVNASQRVFFEHQLYARDLDFKQVEGSYEGKREVSYIVLIQHPYDEHAVLQLARRYGQQSVLSVDANRFATLLLLNESGGGPDIKEFKGLGHWRALAWNEIISEGAAYTKDGSTYYVVTPAA